jgi:hypothetical protein
MHVYDNLPNPHITLHSDATCPEIRKHDKPNQRVVAVSAGTVPSVLSDFIADRHHFAAKAAENDLWLDITLGSPQHEQAFVYVVHLPLAGYYARFQSAQITTHC